MRKKTTVLAMLLIAGGLGQLRAAEKNSKSTEAEMQAMMAAAMKRAAPSEHHKLLESYVGRFATASQMWMNPGDKPQESKGSSEHTWIMGGRFVQMVYKGDFAGQPFEGLGFLGYDNMREEYIGIWLDSFNTGIMKSSGAFEKISGTLKESGTFSCPMTGDKEKWFRGDWKAVNPDTLIYAMYQKDAKGNEFKGMEITYTRLK